MYQALSLMSQEKNIQVHISIEIIKSKNKWNRKQKQQKIKEIKMWGVGGGVA